MMNILLMFMYGTVFLQKNIFCKIIDDNIKVC